MIAQVDEHSLVVIEEGLRNEISSIFSISVDGSHDIYSQGTMTAETNVGAATSSVYDVRSAVAAMESSQLRTTSGWPTSVQTIRPGDTYWDYAAINLGEGTYAGVVERLNPDMPARFLVPGGHLRLPAERTPQIVGFAD